ncbi:MAG: biotin/lipoyl-binding protein, partial [Methylocystaceae bacterium]|nr:biotin/lipoyl-binding protein [Methylocystaceae bacterium]
MQRKAFLVLTIAISLIVGAALPVLLGKWRSAQTPPNQTSQPALASALITLSPEQIRAAKIEIAPAKSGVLLRRLLVPATLKPDPDHLARVAAKVSGVVAEMRVRLGADVQRDETIAVIESREVADAKSEFLAASVNHDLQEQLFQREKGLYEKKIIAEQTFLRAKT